ncbi:unnamed protein product, partial [Meganyctiphanes norvegica]|uniref:Uncharacterized protein n=1 Tax=Meganyctiphanes norvegica TaxID=48144 RepID=A0AAV2QY14_MEGNR
MLTGCIYPNFHSLLPQENEASKSVPSLEQASAKRIISHSRSNNNILNDVPPHLYKSVFQVLIETHHSNYVQSKGGKIPNSFEEMLAQFILDWPEENFILRKLIPSLSPKKSVFSTLNTQCSPLEYVWHHYVPFFSKIIRVLPKVLISGNKGNTHRIRKKLKRLDVSGCCDLVGSRPANIVNALHAAAKASTPTRSKDISMNQVCKSEVLEITTDIGVRDENDVKALCELLLLTSMKESTISVYFRKVSFHRIWPNRVTKLLKALGESRPCFIETMKCGLTNDDLDTICTSMPNLLGLNLIQNHEITSINSITSLKNLEQLNLSQIKLKGKLEPLLNLNKGLQLLNLGGCKLTSDDLKVLSQSHHMSTLRQLDLYGNDLTAHMNLSGLFEILQNLSNLEVLDLSGCNLSRGSSDQLLKLINILKSLPKLTLLHLENNGFSSKYVINYLCGLSLSPSLRCLSLSVPLDVTDEKLQIKNFHDKLFKMINKNRENTLYLSFEGVSEKFPHIR